MGEAKKYILHLFKILKERFCKTFFREEKNLSENAEANSGDQRFLVDGSKERRQVRQDQEEQGQHQVQGEMQPIPVHFGGSRSREGREAQAVSPSWTRGERIEVMELKMADFQSPSTNLFGIFLSASRNFSEEFMFHRFCLFVIFAFGLFSLLKY